MIITARIGAWNAPHSPGVGEVRGLYLYLIAFLADKKKDTPTYFHLARINKITEHRKKFDLSEMPDFDEGLLRKRNLFMLPGKLHRIRFEYAGPSVQAVLDKLTMSKIIERSGGMYLIEAEVWRRNKDVASEQRSVDKGN